MYRMKSEVSNQEYRIFDTEGSIRCELGNCHVSINQLTFSGRWKK